MKELGSVVGAILEKIAIGCKLHMQYILLYHMAQKFDSGKV